MTSYSQRLMQSRNISTFSSIGDLHPDGFAKKKDLGTAPDSSSSRVAMTSYSEDIMQLS